MANLRGERTFLAALLTLYLFPCWTLSFSSSMAGSHVGFDYRLDDLRSEQVDIDNLLERLLNSNSGGSNTTVSPSPGNLSQQRKFSDVVSTPIPGSVKSRGPGRPRSTKTSASASASASQQPKSPAPIVTQEPSLAVVIDCLNKINLQNKKLLGIVGNIVEKIDNVNVNPNVCNKDSNNGVLSTTEVPTMEGNIRNVTNRLEKLKQTANQNTLVCRGPEVESIIKEAEEDGRLSPERLKGDLCTSICGESATNINMSEVRVTVFGRAKKAVKVECPNLTSKVQIIKKARERKPQGLYVNEFLTEAKLKLFLKARALKKLHPSKLKSVFTKGVMSFTL